MPEWSPSTERWSGSTRPAGAQGSPRTRCRPSPSCISATPWQRARAANKLPERGELMLWGIPPMSTEGDLRPAPQPDPGQGIPPSVPLAPVAAPQSWLLRHRRLLIPAAAVLALGAVSAAAVLLLVKPTGAVEKVVPATADVIAVANLDPSVTQKVNLLRAVHSFPDYKTDKAITDKLDEVLKDSGLSFSADIQPWLGSEIGASVRLNLKSAAVGSAADSPAAFYAVSRDDTKARAMLAKLRASK